jgi:hypothetical protein
MTWQALSPRTTRPSATKVSSGRLIGMGPPSPNTFSPMYGRSARKAAKRSSASGPLPGFTPMRMSANPRSISRKQVSME